MTKNVTKVTHKSKQKVEEKVSPSAGWESVLVDIETDIQTLKRHREIVRRKIASHEPWPGDGKQDAATN